MQSSNSQRLIIPLTLYNSYLYGIMAVGLAFVINSVFHLEDVSRLLNFWLLVGLAVIAQNVTTSAAIYGGPSVTYAIGQTVSLAAVPFFGPWAAVLIEFVAGVTQWFFKPEDKVDWKRSFTQLGFNIGMFTISIYVAAVSLNYFLTLFAFNPFLQNTLPWLLAATVNLQTNIILLLGIIYLQNKGTISPLKLWKENLWASQINIIITAVGAATLSFAMSQYDWVAILIFFLPIAVSAYAFRLYVRQMQQHLDNLENIVAERTAELQQLMQEKDSFLAVLTHDMKSPLTSIGIFIEMLTKFPSLPQQKPHMLNTIHNSQKSLVNIVNNILDLEKLQVEGGLPLEMTSINIKTIGDAIIEEIRMQANQKSITIAFHASDEQIEIMADQFQIERVLQNLLSNAIKYTPKNGKIAVSLTKRGRFAIISVEDSGFGIPETELPHIFDRFRRVTKHEKIAAGTGLGLAISKAIVDAHGGYINAISEEGRGSTFTIGLPLS